MFSVRFVLRLWLIIMLGIDTVQCEVCTEAVVDHNAGDRHCSVWGLCWGCGWSLCWGLTLFSVRFVLRLWLISMLGIDIIHCEVSTEAVVDLYAGDRHCSLWGLYWGCGWSLCWGLTLFTVRSVLRLWLISMLGIDIVQCEVCTEAVIDHYAGDRHCLVWGLCWGCGWSLCWG